MATYHSSITDEQAQLIRSSMVFFVASADPALAHGPNDVGPINVSPKGGVPLHILDPNRVAFLDYVGSGNETTRPFGGGWTGHVDGLLLRRRECRHRSPLRAGARHAVGRFALGATPA